MGKRKSKRGQLDVSWCYYCDRTFEDDKVLLQHQKAKHFKCPHCPRRLNTAGGLAVHIDQVHKLGTDKIENALPGRDGFDVEIYGMEGIPAAALAAWKRKRAEELGQPLYKQASKKAKIANVVIPVAELKAQLETHKALMLGIPLKVNLDEVDSKELGEYVGGLPFPPPPPGALLPNFPAPLPFPPPPRGLNFGALLAALPNGVPPPPGMDALNPALKGGYERTTFPEATIVERVASSAVTTKPGTLLVYGDNEVSPEEKRAKLSQYRLPK